MLLTNDDYAKLSMAQHQVNHIDIIPSFKRMNHVMTEEIKPTAEFLFSDMFDPSY